MENKKRAQSEVVATVLIILLVITIVSVVSIFVIKLVRDSSNFDSSNLELSYNSGDTFYYPGGEEVYVSVSRGAGEVNLSALKIVVYTEGESRTCIRENVPGVNGKKTYKFIGFPKSPDYIEVIPALTYGNKEKFVKGIGKISLENQSSPFVFEEGEFGGSCGDEDNFPLEPENIDNL